MKNFQLSMFFLLLVLLNNRAFPQQKPDSILMINGDVFHGKVIRLTERDLVVKDSEKAVQEFNIDKELVFSYSNATGEYIVYTYDTLSGNDFTIDEMRYFIRGEQDGKKGFKARPAFYTNMVIGAASGITGSVFFPVPVFAFAVLAGIPKVKINRNTVRNQDDLTHPPYIMGYERMARRKRKIQSLVGGGIGLVAGIGTFFILQASDKEILQ